MDDITEYLASYEHVSKKANETEIRNLCERIKYLLGCCDQVFSLLRTPRYGATDGQSSTIEGLIKEIEKQWKTLGLNHTPKFHSLMRHALWQFRLLRGFGDLLEDDMEKSHQDGARFERRVAGLQSEENKCASFSRNEKINSNPKVAAAGKYLMQKTKRNFRRVSESSSTRKKLDERLEKVQKRESDFVASQTQEVVTMAPFLVAKSEFVEERKNEEELSRTFSELVKK